MKTTKIHIHLKNINLGQWPRSAFFVFISLNEWFGMFAYIPGEYKILLLCIYILSLAWEFYQVYLKCQWKYFQITS